MFSCAQKAGQYFRPAQEVDVIEFIGSALLAVLLLFLSVGAAKYLLLPLVRWALISGFQALKGEEGDFSRTVRQVLSYPVRALLSRQRKARHGDADSQTELFFVDVGFGLLISSAVQGIGLTLLTALCVAVLAVIGFVVADF